MSAIRKLKTPSTQCNTQPWRLGSSSFHRDRGPPVMVSCDPFLLSLHCSRGKGFKSSLCQHAAPSVLAVLEPRRAFAQEFSDAVCGWCSTHGVRRRPQVSCHSRSCSWAPCSAHSEFSPPNVSQAYLLVACMCKLRSFSLLSHSLYTLAYIAISLSDEGKRYMSAIHYKNALINYMKGTLVNASKSMDKADGAIELAFICWLPTSAQRSSPSPIRCRLLMLPAASLNSLRLLQALLLHRLPAFRNICSLMYSASRRIANPVEQMWWHWLLGSSVWNKASCVRESSRITLWVFMVWCPRLGSAPSPLHDLRAEVMNSMSQWYR
jgi:hypothetical protein